MYKFWLFLAVVTLTLSERGFTQNSIRIVAGDVDSFFTAASEIGTESEVIEHSIISPGQPTIIRKIPGRLKQFHAILKRPVGQDAALSNWRKLVETGAVETARRNCTITLLDQAANKVASWTLTNCWPTSIKIQTVDGVLMEEVVLACEGVQRDQP